MQHDQPNPTLNPLPPPVSLLVTLLDNYCQKFSKDKINLIDLNYLIYQTIQITLQNCGFWPGKTKTINHSKPW